jgi:hypothetical protein
LKAKAKAEADEQIKSHSTDDAIFPPFQNDPAVTPHPNPTPTIPFPACLAESKKNRRHLRMPTYHA